MPNYVAVGSEFVINTVTQNTQQRPDLAKLKSGGFVAVWESNDLTQDTDGFGIRGRMIGADGVPAGPEFQINSVSYDWQTTPSVAGLADGGFVVTWTTDATLGGTGGRDIKAQRFDASGAKAGPEFFVNTHTSATQWLPNVAALDNGGFVVAWETYDTTQDGSGNAMKAQIFDAAGAKIGSEILVNTVTAFNQVNGEISALSGGRFIVTWHHSVNGEIDVRAQVFNSSGAKIGGEIVVNSQTAGSQVEVAVTNLANGGFVITWRTYDTAQDGSGHAVKAQVFDAAGAKVGGELLVNTATASNQFAATVAGLDNGDFVVAWRTDDVAADGSNGAIKAQVFSSTGLKLGGEFLVNSTAMSAELDPSVIDLGGGSFAIAWGSSLSNTFNYNIHAQIFSAAPSPRIVSNGGGESASVSVGENQDSVTTVAATDPDGPAGLSYSIVGGSDASRFVIDSETGAVRFHSTPDFEAPSDSNGDNVYQLIVRASDGQYFDDQTINVAVANVNEAVTIISDGGGLSADVHVAEGTRAVTTVEASDEDASPRPGYSIAGGADSHLFTIDAASGVLSFIEAPDHENASDSGADNVYSVIVRASDGTNSDEQLVSVHVADLDEGITFSVSAPAFRIEENLIEAGGFQAISESGDPIVFSITGGADAALFAIDPATGRLSFLAAPDFEAPGDSGGDNVYDLEVTARDGAASATQSARVTVLDFDEPIRLTSYAGAENVALTVSENGVSAAQVAAGDPEGAQINYYISGGSDAHLFAIGLATGTLTFIGAPNFEAPADHGGNNVYDVQVRAASGSSSAIQSFAITVANVNEGFMISSGGGGAAASYSVAENSTAVTVVTTFDPNGTVAYSITGGTDASRFAIDSATGALRFVAAPNFESRMDSNGDNIYNLVVTASDGQLSDSQALAVTVTNVNEAPVIQASQPVRLHIENNTEVERFYASDPESRPVTWSIAGGPDAAHFAIDTATGVLRFIAAPNYEAPTDDGANNFYNVTIAASDGSLSTTRAVTVEILNWDEAPFIVSGGGGATGSVTVAENKHHATTILFDDPDARDPSITYSIVGGADAALFFMAQNGQLFFRNNVGGNFEAPHDAGGNNVYDIVVSISDGFNTPDTQALSIIVTDANDKPVITSNGGGFLASVSMPENLLNVTTVVAADLENGPLTYAIVASPDASLFAINAQTGVLTFKTAPDREAPRDSGANHVYNVTVSATDGEWTATQQLSITVLDSNEAPAITSNGGGSAATLTVDENEVAVTKVAATDPEGKALSFAITGGADAERFTINAATGVLSFVAPEDYERPRDSDQDNIYDVIVSASDGSLSDTQALSIAIGNLNFVNIMSDGGNDWADLWIDENQTAVTIVQADDDDNSVAYSISGDNAEYFTIDAQTGELRFTAAPDYETPGGWRDQNIYYVTVTASSGTISVSQDLTVYINDVPELELVHEGGEGQNGEILVPENGTAVTTLSVIGGSGPITYEIVGGNDAPWFAIDPETGVLSFASEPDYENGKYGDEPPPWADEDYLHLYEVVVRASDGATAAEKALLVRVQDVDEAPEFYYHDGADHVEVSVAENSVGTVSVAAWDPDRYSWVTYTLEGADAALFEMSAYHGGLVFRQALDREAPIDADGDNVYELSVVAHSGALSATQSFSITIGNEFEPVSISSNGGGDSATLTVPENGTAVTVVTAVGDGPISYEVVGGADGDWFTLDPYTGALSFVGAPNYEDYRKKGHGNHGTNYYVTVRAYNDGSYDDQSLTIQVQDVDEAPTFVSYGGAADVALTVNENVQAVAIARAYDPDDVSTVAYALAGGADSALFEIDPTSGALRLKQGADFEAPADSDGDNVYEVTVSANPGAASATQAFSITIADVDENVAITSNGGSASATVSVAENVAAVTTISASSGLAVTYSIVGGADRALFSIDPSTGALAFASTPDFETSADSDRDNVFEVIVRASNGVASDDQHLSVAIRDVNEGVTITSAAAASVVENGAAVTKVTAQDLDGDPVGFAISGGPDSALFAIDPLSGELRFLAAPNFEAPADSNGDNIYEVEVSAGDGTLSDSKTVSVTVTNEDEAIVIVSGGGGAEAALTVDENEAEVMSLLAVDLDGSTPQFSIMGGADRDSFYIDPDTQVLRFKGRPGANPGQDFETPRDSDGDNVYEVLVAVANSHSVDWQTISVTVANAFEGFGWGPGGRSFFVQEGTEEIGSIASPEDAGLPVVYSLTGAFDSSLFSIDSVSGMIRWIAPADFEAPRDWDGDRVYVISVAASDGKTSDNQYVYVTVGNEEEAVAIVSGGGGDEAAVTVNENDSAVTSLLAVDPDGSEVRYAIAGGADAARFVIDPSTGALAFVAAPDFESTRSADGDNVFDVTVSASDGSSTDSQTLSVILDDVVEGIFITSHGGANSVSMTLTEGYFTTYDVDAWHDTGVFAPIVYSLSGADAAFFTIDNQGRFSFDYDAPPNFEGPADADGDNVYDVTVTASISTFRDSQAFAITVADRDENVVFTSGGGEPFASFTVAENGIAAATVAAVDPEGGAVTYAISGGFDAAFFTIDPNTGALAFITAPDFELPADHGSDGVYNVSVTATDGTFVASQFIDITVENVDEPIEILSYGGASAVALRMTEGAGLTVATVQADDEEDWIVAYSITGGADAALFRIDASTGVLVFNYGVYPDFEAPADAGADNVYDVVVTASSSTSSADQAFALTIADRNEGLRITSNGGGDADLAMNEGQRGVTIVTAEDQDGDVPTYSIVGGADSASFAIDAATGALTFIAAPDYETPGSAAGTNVYLVEVGAGDGEFLATQRIRIQIGNVNEAPVITSGGGGAAASVAVNENGLEAANVTASDADGNILAYSIAGGADASRFTINAQTGALRFVQAPNFEAPADSGANNVYDVIVSVTDGLLTDSQAVAVTVANLAEIVTITSNGGGSGASLAVAENGTAVTTVTAGNPDGGAAVTYAIAGGADAARFTINAATGALAFLAAPNFEAPADSGANNVYDVVVSASNGATTDTQALAVTVGNVNEPLAITSNGGGAGATVVVAENGSAVTTVAASDPDGGPVTYAIVGGADSGRFTINAATGVLAFRAAPDFEAPGDSGGNNVYDLVVSASDGIHTDTQTIAVTVGNVNEAPVITSNGAGATGNVSVAENSLLVTVVAAADAEGATAVYSIVGGADAARFTINAQTGVLQFIAPPDWEMPGNSSQNNVYAVVVRASDGALADDQALSVTVTNVRDGNNVTGTSGGETISATSTNVSLRTSNEEDLVFARDGHDSIYGMGGDDELYGEGGNDILAGGEGADKLLGGLGKDQFTFAAVSESAGALRDLIMDFSRAQGDKISLSSIDSNSALFGNQAFTFIGTAAFSNTAGQLRYETAGGMTTIFGDVNGDGVADLQIQLSGSIALISSDFIL